MGVKIVPLNTNIVLKPIPVETQTASGIYRSDAAETTSHKAEVIAVAEHADITISAGDIVLYKQYGGEEVIEDGEIYVIVKYEDIYAVIG